MTVTIATWGNYPIRHYVPFDSSPLSFTACGRDLDGTPNTRWWVETGATNQVTCDYCARTLARHIAING